MIQKTLWLQEICNSNTDGGLFGVGKGWDIVFFLLCVLVFVCVNLCESYAFLGQK